MASVIYVASFTGGSALTVSGGPSARSLAEVLRDIVTDITAIRTSFVGVTAKLDADAGITDVNYASTWDPAAMGTTNG